MVRGFEVGRVVDVDMSRSPVVRLQLRIRARTHSLRRGVPVSLSSSSRRVSGWHRICLAGGSSAGSPSAAAATRSLRQEAAGVYASAAWAGRSSLAAFDRMGCVIGGRAPAPDPDERVDQKSKRGAERIRRSCRTGK